MILWSRKGTKHDNTHGVLLCLLLTLLAANLPLIALEQSYGGIRGTLYTKNCVEILFLELEIGAFE